MIQWLISVHRVEHVPTREGGSDELSSFDVTESNQYSQRGM